MSYLENNVLDIQDVLVINCSDQKYQQKLHAYAKYHGYNFASCNSIKFKQNDAKYKCLDCKKIYKRSDRVDDPNPNRFIILCRKDKNIYEEFDDCYSGNGFKYIQGSENAVLLTKNDIPNILAITIPTAAPKSHINHKNCPEYEYYIVPINKLAETLTERRNLENINDDDDDY